MFSLIAGDQLLLLRVLTFLCVCVLYNSINRSSTVLSTGFFTDTSTEFSFDVFRFFTNLYLFLDCAAENKCSGNTSSRIVCFSSMYKPYQTRLERGFEGVIRSVIRVFGCEVYKHFTICRVIVLASQAC